MFGKKAKVDQKTLGVVVVDAPFICNLFTAEGVIIVPKHPVKSVKVHSMFFEKGGGQIVLLVSSPDIPDYVAFTNVMEQTKFYGIEGVQYPLIGMRFDVIRHDGEIELEGGHDVWI